MVCLTSLYTCLTLLLCCSLSTKQWHFPSLLWFVLCLYTCLTPSLLHFFYTCLTLLLICSLFSKVFTPVALSFSAFLCCSVSLPLSCLGPTALISSQGRQTVSVHVRVIFLKLCLHMFAAIL